MNKEFIKKMIKAEALKYEAIKEILPDKVRKRVDDIEKEAFSLIKDIAIYMIQEEKDEKEEKKITKKVEVDFS
jgi:DNA-directed RNA polymerase beta' subunit